jgi:hypothetical protein
MHRYEESPMAKARSKPPTGGKPAETPKAEKKKSPGRPPSVRDDVTVKIARPTARMARAVADFRGAPFAEYLTILLDGPVRADYATMLRELEGREFRR